MRHYYQKTIAMGLIMALVFPFVTQAQNQTNLNAQITIDGDTSSAASTNIKAKYDKTTTNTNFDTLAPDYTTSTDTASATIITRVTPSITLDAKKKEGIWGFTVSRYGELASATIKHDLTPPKCPPAPTDSQYKNEDDYYTNNNLLNPWPVGLNGQWAKNTIAFDNDDPTLCRDQISSAENTTDICAAEGGVLITSGLIKFCRFDQAYCPVDWSPYKNWSTTVSNYCEDLPCGVSFTNGKCSTEMHGWSNRPVESCMYQKYSWGQSCEPTEGTGICSSSVTQIGCLPDGQPSINTTITTPSRYVERNYTTGLCENADGTPLHFYKEDLEDCLQEIKGKKANLTRPSSEMAGCKFTRNVSLNAHQNISDFALYDKAGNNNQDNENYEICKTPKAKIDRFGPVIQTLEIEHKGLSLSKEALEKNQVTANRFRADNGPLLLHVNMNDANVVEGSGRSGLNWQPLPSNIQINKLVTDINNVQSSLTNRIEELNTMEVDIILIRTRILTKLALLQKHIIINNLLKRLSANVNNSNNFFMQAIITVSSGLNNLKDLKVNENRLQKLKDLLARNKFNSTTQIESIRANLDAVNALAVNTKIKNYSRDLPLLLLQSNITEQGDEIDIRNTNSNFQKNYNQFQIDKSKNYSKILHTWTTDLNKINISIETLYDEYRLIKAAYESNDVLQLAQILNTLSPSSNLLTNLLSTETTAVEHRAEQENTINAINTANQQLQASQTYLNEFNPSTDTFDNNKISQVIQSFSDLNDNIGTLQRELEDKDTPGSFSNSLYGLGEIENSNEIKQLITAEKSIIRALNFEVLGLKTDLEAKVIEQTTKENQIRSQERALLRIKSKLTQLKENLVVSKGVSLSGDKITHLTISRITGTNQNTQEFFPPTTTAKTGNNFVWDLNSFKFTGEKQEIFSKAATYKITVKAFDKAGNKSQKTGYIQILPGTLFVNVQNNCNLSSNIPYADNIETCSIEIPQFDNFGNKIQNRDLKLSVRDQNIKGSYNLVKELGENYQNGIRFNDGKNIDNKNILTWKPNNAELKTVQIRSLLPTITVLPYKRDTNYAVGYKSKNGADLPLILTHPNIGPRGAPIAPVNQTNLELPVQFKPWVNVKVKGGLGAFDNRSWHPKVANSFNLYVDATTGSTRKLPTNFRVNVAGFIGPSFEFNEADLSKPGRNVDFANVSTAYIESTGKARKPAPLTTTINSTSLLSGQQNSSALFIPTTTYRIGPRTITVPGLPAGSCPGDTSEECFEESTTAASVDLTISNATANEPGTLSFNIGLSSAYEKDIRVYLKASDNNTTIGEDYTFEPTRFVEIKTGELGATYNITVNDDNEVEDTETFVLSVDTFEPAGALGNYSDTGIGTIDDLDNGLEINTGLVTEGSLCLLGIKLGRPTDSDVVITASLGASGDTATAGADYIDTDVSATIIKGETAALLSIQTNEDIIREGTESFTVTINSVTGGNLSDLQGVAVCEITDNDREPNAYLLNTNVREGGKARITVVLGEQNQSGLPDNEDVVLRLETFDLTDPATSATETLDYQARTFDITIPANTKSVTVPLSQGIETYTDDEIEDDESFGVRIIGVMQGKIGDYSRPANVLIEDASTPPRPSISSISTESGVEKTPNDTIAFDVLLDHPNESGEDITIILETEDISATGGDDYSAGNLTVVIPNGKSSGKSTPVTINDDITPEDIETFRVKVLSSSPSNALLNSNADGIGYIYDNDGVHPDITINDATACESANCDGVTNGSLVFEVNLSKPHTDKNNLPLEVVYKPTPLTAAPNTDYTPGEYKAIFNVGDQKAFLEAIPLINNADPEEAEKFEVSFVRIESSHSLGSTIDTAIGTITDNQNSAAPNVIIDGNAGIEGGLLEFAVSLDSPAQGRLEIELSPNNITTNSNDYTCPADMIVIFDDGEMEAQTITCTLNLDDENEPNETFEVIVSNTSGTVNNTSDKAIATISNLQTLDLVLKEPSIVMEDDLAGQIEFILSLEDNGLPLNSETSLESPMNIAITPEDLLAVGGTNFNVSGIDYRSGVINVALEPGKGEGSTFAKIGVAINNDSIKEVNRLASTYPENRQENLNMALVASARNIRSITDTEAIIQDDDNRPCANQANVKIVDTMEVEGDRMVFDINLDRPLCNEAVTLNFETVNAGAEAGIDYIGGNYSITIPAKKRRPLVKLSIPTTQDLIHEGNENFQLRYVSSSPSNLINKAERYSIRNDNSHQNQGEVPVIATIIDNDGPENPPPDMTIDNTSATEGANLNFVVNLSKVTEEKTVIRLRANELSPNPASPHLDFTTFGPNPGTVIAVVSILAGQGTGIARVSTLDDIIANEGNENLALGYAGLTQGFLSDVSDTGNGIIYDNDDTPLTPRVIITDGSAEEGSPITFTLKLENALGESVVAPTGGIDFTIATSTLAGPNTADPSEFGNGKIVRIAEGTSQRDFTIDTVEDDLDENDEIFSLSITGSNKGIFVNNDLLATAVGTIVDNDGPASDTCELYGINCPEEEVAKPGAAIEGQIITDEISCIQGVCDGTDDDSIVLGNSTLATDIREEITRNAYELIRGRIADNSDLSTIPLNNSGKPIIKRNDFTHNGRNYPRWDIYVDDLPDGGVTYLNGDINNDGNITGDEQRAYFRIGLRRNGTVGTLNNPATVSGKHTFVVINASLNIVGDMRYAGNDDSLGIIVLNDDLENAQSNSRRGQLTIFKDVRHIVGALFTDGSLVSNIWINAGDGSGRLVHGNDANSTNDWDIINGMLGRQLILSGNILSKNTIGKADKAPPEGPWGEDLSGPNGQLKAQMYDFNYMRRYVPSFNASGVQTNTNQCSNIPGQSGCYNNSKSFVIRVDPRLKENAPPGFTADGITKFR